MTSLKFSVLVVEDDGYTRNTVLEMIAASYPDAITYSADNGRSGLEIFKLHYPDIVITDLAMPMMDGICMAAEMKQVNPDAVVVAVTAYTDPHDMLKAIEIGIDHYLLKPLKVEKLFALIDRVRRSKAEAAQRKLNEEAHRMCEARHQEELGLLNKMLERRVRERTAELESAVRELEAFSYSVSHDLRAPLRHINCFSAMMVEDFGNRLPEEARGYLDRIGAASSRMGALIDHLLELSRVMRVGIRHESVDVSTLAASILAMLQETEPARRVDTVIEEGISVSGDPYLLRQLLENLLGNAWKYTSRKEVARIEFGSMKGAGEGTIFVKDNGAGFDMAYQSGLFQVFQRLHGQEFQGLGIGLATAHRIVERHGGEIWAEAKVEEGATFYFTLPVASRNLTRADTEEQVFRLCHSASGEPPAAYA